jgi:hypothetical protein
MTLAAGEKHLTRIADMAVHSHLSEAPIAATRTQPETAIIRFEAVQRDACILPGWPVRKDGSPLPGEIETVPHLSSPAASLTIRLIARLNQVNAIGLLEPWPRQRGWDGRGVGPSGRREATAGGRRV